MSLSSNYLRNFMFLVAPLGLGLTACESDPATSPDSAEFAVASGEPVVTVTNPSATIQDTTIDVHVLGSGFDRGSKVEFAIGGVVEPKLRVNSVKYVRSSDLLANVTVSADAPVARYDVIVTAATGKKGIGTERFAVLSMMDLGTPSGGYSYGRDVNSSGIVVGEYQVAGASCKRAYLWSDATEFLVLPQSSLGCTNYATSINDAGVIVGHVYGGGAQSILRWKPNAGSWTLEHLAAPAGFTLSGGGATDISENGTILAEYLSSSDGTYRQLLLTEGGWQLLERSTAAASTACWINGFGVNDARQAVGTDCNGALFWASPAAAPVYLPVPSGHGKAVAYDINDAGVVVGKSTNLSTGKRRACRWLPDGSGGFTHEDLGDLGGGESEARSINNEGRIAGWSSASTAGNSMRAFLWTAGFPMQALGTLQNQNAAALAVSNSEFGPVYLSGWSVGSAKGSYQRAIRWTE
jgi:probable HAF family extracellular repeat protein